MTVEIGSVKPRAIDFTYKGKKLAVRKMPLSLGLKLQTLEDDVVPPDLVAEIIAKCVVDEKGNQVWRLDEVLELDLDPMLQLFSEVSGAALTAEEAEKN